MRPVAPNERAAFVLAVAARTAELVEDMDEQEFARLVEHICIPLEELPRKRAASEPLGWDWNAHPSVTSVESVTPGDRHAESSIVLYAHYKNHRAECFVARASELAVAVTEWEKAVARQTWGRRVTSLKAAIDERLRLVATAEERQALRGMHRVVSDTEALLRRQNTQP